jgi:trk system potassium uptake protein TrkH
MVAFFHSVSCRTAGFNTVDIASLTNATLFITILLMAIGAGPCSTAGGFKVSTVMVLIVQALNTFSGHTRLNMFRRTVPPTVMARATATLMLFGVVAMLALTTLLVLEQSASPHPDDQGVFLDAAFEVVSALGTVGLSTGMTGELGQLGSLILIMLMFMGRLGPISVFVALSRSERKEPVEYPSEEPMIG